MKIIDLGKSGTSFSETSITWQQLPLPDEWLQFINAVAPSSLPHDIQVRATEDGRLLISRRNLVAAGPTNSGKSLLGYLAILSEIGNRRRALLIEPYKALAQEKADELQQLLPQIKALLGYPPKIEITTGDYRLVGETLTSPPPAEGEIVIATPERIDAIMRNSEFDEWISSFGIVCVDEAHLIGDRHRGATLEGVMTRFLCETAPPRFVLLSATIGDCRRLEEWLQPCDVVTSNIRRPPLYQKMIVLETEEKADDILISNLEKILAETDASVIVFVYRTADADRLAQKICDHFQADPGAMVAAAYHSKMPSSRKNTIRSDYEAGKIRCLVSTTALGAGVNLPAIHVFLRDVTFGMDGPLPVAEILQIMGRAGRGNRSGHAGVILKPNDKWEVNDLTEQLKCPRLPELRSALNLQDSYRSNEIPMAAKLVLGQIIRREEQSLEDLHHFFERSFGGGRTDDQIDLAVNWLCDAQHLLAWQNEGMIGATALGRAVSKSGIFPEVGAGFGSLIRDVLTCDDQDNVLKRWSPIDTLVTLELMKPNEKGLKRITPKLGSQIDAWVESSSEKPVLYIDWIRGTPDFSKAEEVIGSLGINLENGKKKRSQTAWEMAYGALFRSIVIYQLGCGKSIADIKRRWKVKDIDGVQERWRDHLLWLLSGISEILDIRCFYYCLKEECQANDARVNTVKSCFKDMQRGVFNLMGLLRFCSPLGPVFKDLEAARAGVGIRTKEKLENGGIYSFVEINKMSIKDLQKLGIRKDIAVKLKGYVRRRGM